MFYGQSRDAESFLSHPEGKRSTHRFMTSATTITLSHFTIRKTTTRRNSRKCKKDSFHNRGGGIWILGHFAFASELLPIISDYKLFSVWILNFTTVILTSKTGGISVKDELHWDNLVKNSFEFRLAGYKRFKKFSLKNNLFENVFVNV